MIAPGMTSCIELQVGFLTLQTEFVGDPPELITVIDLAGRVIRRIRTPCPPGVDLAQFVQRTHADIDRKLRLAVDARRREDPNRPPLGDDDTAALLFLLAVEAYLDGDAISARQMLSCVADLLPDDATIASNLRALDR